MKGKCFIFLRLGRVTCPLSCLGPLWISPSLLNGPSWQNKDYLTLSLIYSLKMMSHGTIFNDNF